MIFIIEIIMLLRFDDFIMYQITQICFYLQKLFDILKKFCFGETNLKQEQGHCKQKYRTAKYFSAFDEFIIIKNENPIIVSIF